MTTVPYIPPPPTTEEAKRRYDAWVIGFTRRVRPTVAERDQLVAVARTAARAVRLPPFTIADAAKALNIPGSTPGARAQKLRRMERDGLLPKAHRSTVRRQRYYLAEELAELVAR